MDSHEAAVAVAEKEGKEGERPFSAAMFERQALNPLLQD